MVADLAEKRGAGLNDLSRSHTQNLARDAPRRGLHGSATGTRTQEAQSTPLAAAAEVHEESVVLMFFALVIVAALCGITLSGLAATRRRR